MGERDLCMLDQHALAALQHCVSEEQACTSELFTPTHMDLRFSSFLHHDACHSVNKLVETDDTDDEVADDYNKIQKCIYPASLSSNLFPFSYYCNRTPLGSLFKDAGVGVLGAI